MKRLTPALTALLTACAAATAAVPSTYYQQLNGKTTQELKNAVYQTVNPHTTISSYSDLPRYFERTDIYPGTSRWWDMYSDIPLYAPSFKGLNREHAFPKSWWGGSTDTPAYIDLNHLYPSEAEANQAKSNYPLGKVATAKFANGITTVGYPVSGQGGGAQQVFEPDNEYKGDFARTYFYMVTCYQNLTWKYTYMVQNNTYPTLNAWARDLLLQWHRDDPVSQKEIDRNETIYSIQNNRNPFIDFPDLAEYIWGNRMGEPFEVTGTVDPTPAGDPEIITPQNGMSLDFPDVAIGSKSTARLFFRTKDFTKDISVVVSGTSRAYFTPADRSIRCSLTNTDTGYWLTINYQPPTTGQHEAKLVVYDGNITGSFSVTLRGQCFDIPTLTPPVAETEWIEPQQYMARWETPQDQTVDYYIVNRTSYTGSQAVTEQLLAEDNSLLITGFDLSDRETFTVQSVRLGHTSEPSNTVYVDHTGIPTAPADSPLAIQTLPGGTVRIIASEIHTHATIYTPAGQLVASFATLMPDQEITLSPGIYLLRTAQHPRAVKIAIR